MGTAYSTTVLGAIAAKPSGTKRKDCGTILYAGNKASGSRITKSLDIDSQIHDGINGGVVTSAETLATIALGTATKPTFKPYSAGTYAYQPAAVQNSSTGQFGQQFIIANVTSKVSNVANTTFTFTGSQGKGKQFNSIEKYRTLKQSSWDWVTGKAGTNTVEQNYAGISTINDAVVHVTRAAPANILYIETGKNATTKTPTAKTD
jgi:hypothetical protein